MKQVLALLLVVALTTGCKSKGKNKGWSEAERKAFMESCEQGGSAMGDKAKPYCECMMAKLEDKYPSAEDAGKLDMNSTMEMAKDCLK